jgi:serine/threonine protein kinase
LATGETVAIKKIREVFNNLTDAKRILREISLISRLTHPNMVRIIDILEPPKDMAEFRDLYIVFEYVESDLARVLNSQQPLLRDQLQYITMQLLAGMRHMHAAHVLHRDLKPQNVLVSRFCEIKICDLGLARGIAELASSGDGPAGPAFSPNPMMREEPASEVRSSLTLVFVLAFRLQPQSLTP